MKRRQVLAGATGVLAGLAGCISGGEGEQASREQSSTTTGTPPDGGTDGENETSTDGTATADVTVEHLALQHGYVAPNSPDSIGIRHEDRQYLVASVAVDGAVERDAFALALDGQTVAPTTPERFYRTSWGDEQWYAPEQSAGLLLFALPADAAAGSATLDWPGGHHEVGESITDRIGLEPPEMTVTFAMSETATPDDPPTVAIEVTNEGDRTRRFLGALNRSGPQIAYTPLARLSRLVDPGETVTVTYDDDWYNAGDDDGVGDDEPDLTYRLSSLGGGAHHEMRLVESSQSTATET